MRHRVVIYGAGEFAKVLLAEFRLVDAPIDVAGLVADRGFIRESTVLGLPVTPFEDAEATYPPSEFEMLVLTGYRRMRDRAATFNKAKAKGYGLFSFVSPLAITHPDLRIGENCLVAPGAHIDSNCRLADNVMVRCGAFIGGTTTIGPHTYVAARAAIGGLTEVGPLCFIGLNATVTDRSRIAEETFIAAGAVVSRATEPFSQYAGNPAVKRGEHRETGILFFT